MTAAGEARSFTTINLAMWGAAALVGVAVALLSKAGYETTLTLMAAAGLLGFGAGWLWNRRRHRAARRRRSASATEIGGGR